MSKNKISNAEIDERLKHRSIRRVGDCVDGTCSKIDFLCLVENCGFKWKVRPNDLFHGAGCPKCSKKIRLTNEVIDIKLVNSSIDRMGNIVNGGIHIEWKCKTCFYVWSATPHNIVRGKGCPRCAGNLPLNNALVDKRLDGKNIRRLGEYINNHTKIEFCCLIDKCGYIWKAIPNNVFKGKGCPKCAGNARLSNEIIDERLFNRPIIRVGNFINSQHKLEWQCGKCFHVWETTASSILSNKTGCPKCSIQKNEKSILTTFDDNNLNFKYQFRIKELNPIYRTYRVDFYFPEKNIIIEYNGQQHYEPVRFGCLTEEQAIHKFEKQQFRDNYIKDVCKENSIYLIEINGLKYTNDKLHDYIINIIDNYLT